jgi:hypothetical protein
LQGLWLPSLGATGDALIDIGPHGIDGEFFNTMAWNGVGENAWNVDLPGSLDFAYLGQTVPELVLNSNQTFTARARFTSSADGIIYGRGGPTDDPTTNIMTYAVLNTGQMFVFYEFGNGTNVSLTTTQTVPDFAVGNWMDLSFIFSNGGTVFSCWANGVFLQEFTGLSPPAGGTLTHHSIGARVEPPIGTNVAASWPGNIASCAYHSRLLEPSEIQHLHRDSVLAIVEPQPQIAGSSVPPPSGGLAHIIGGGIVT